MPCSVRDLFDCWQGCLKSHPCLGIWRLVPHCVLWCIWRERNDRHSEDCEWTMLEFKLFFFQTLYEWVVGLGIFSLHTIVELIDFCTL